MHGRIYQIETHPVTKDDALNLGWDLDDIKPNRALFKKFCKRDFCDEVRDFKIPEPEAVAS